MAKPKFERTKPHVNVGTIFIVLSVLSCLNLFADDKIFDFDGRTSDKAALLEKIAFPKNFQLSDEPNGIMERKFFRITESGQEIEVLPEEINDGKAYYKFKPNEIIFSDTQCSYQKTHNTTWNLCEYYKFYPSYGGHNHDGNIPPYTWNNQPVPNPKCFYNIPVNQPIRVYYKVPEFATRDEHRKVGWGACEGTIYDIVDIKIDGLVLLPPAWQDSLHGGVTYYQLVGRTDTHPINHFGKNQTLDLLKQIAWQYNIEFPIHPVLCINDISLRWGGLFDYEANWQPNPGHKFHRYGRQADLRIWTIPPENRQRFVEMACEYGVEAQIHKGILPIEMENVDFSWVPCDSTIANDLDIKYKAPHYHLKFPKYDDEVDNPADELPADCPSSK